MYSPIKRGQSIWPYTITADERMVELDVDEVVYDHHSAYQRITILHSKNLGNLLFLDGDISKLLLKRLCLANESFGFCPIALVYKYNIVK